MRCGDLAAWHGTRIVTSAIAAERHALLTLCCVTCSPGPCITNVIATCRKNFSQWERSFLWKLRCHWLKFLRRVAKNVSNTGPCFIWSSAIWIQCDTFATHSRNATHIYLKLLYMHYISPSAQKVYEHQWQRETRCKHQIRRLILKEPNIVAY